MRASEHLGARAWHHGRVATTDNKKSPAKKAARPAKKPAAAAKKPGPRADYGAPVDGFFAKQTPQRRAILEALRTMVEKAAPDATSSLKWGMPFFALGGETMCAIASHKAHVNLILAGPPGTYADPRGLLEGDGKTGRHLKITSLEDLPRKEIAAWLGIAARRARKGA